MNDRVALTGTTTCSVKSSAEHWSKACPSPIDRAPGRGGSWSAGKRAYEWYWQIWKQSPLVLSFWLSPMMTSSFTAKVYRSSMFDLMDFWNFIRSCPKRQRSFAFGIFSAHNVGNKSSARTSMWIRASFWIALKAVAGAGWNTREWVRFKNWVSQCCLCAGQLAVWQRLSYKCTIFTDNLIRWEKILLTQYIATRHLQQRQRPGFVVWQK